MPWLPLGRGSQFFFGFSGTASSRQRLFCGTGLSPPNPSPSEVRPFEPRCQQHRGSLHLRLRCLGIPLPRPTARRPGAHRARSSRILQAGFQLRKNPEQSTHSGSRTQVAFDLGSANRQSLIYFFPRRKTSAKARSPGGPFSIARTARPPFA
jgi:hypothetical protein